MFQFFVVFLSQSEADRNSYVFPARIASFVVIDSFLQHSIIVCLVWDRENILSNKSFLSQASFITNIDECALSFISASHACFLLDLVWDFYFSMC